ncbi:MAG TPA: hypothetical protein VI412_04690 [Tabrizicola sp.]|jgi:hypothetical protein
MFDGGIVPFLSLFTLLAVAVLALISKERTKDRMRDPNAPVSTLAKDGKFGGVAFLLPLADRVRVVRRMELARVPVAELRRPILRRDEP